MDITELIEALNTSETRVLECLGSNNETCWFWRGIAKRTGLTMLQTKRAARSIVRKGLADRTAVFDEYDGLLAGSGLSLTRDGCFALRSRTPTE